MIIKAKYPSLERPYMRTFKQGIGSLYGGNQVSDVSQVHSRSLDGSISSVSTSQMFGNGVISLYTNTNTGTQLLFVNESSFIVSDSDSLVTEIDTNRALLFTNESNWVEVPEVDPIDVLLITLQSRSAYYENKDDTRILLENFKNCINE
jgi:hypothetical protein